jgi:hypothetical protein
MGRAALAAETRTRSAPSFKVTQRSGFSEATEPPESCVMARPSRKPPQARAGARGRDRMAPDFRFLLTPRVNSAQTANSGGG